MHRHRRTWLAILLLFGAAVVYAQSDAPEDNTAATDPKPALDATAPEDETEQPSANRPSSEPYFRPSEDISEDLSVAFPIDI